MSNDLLVAVRATWGRPLSPEAEAVLMAELQAYPAAQVFAALARCQTELSGQRLALVDILSRIDLKDVAAARARAYRARRSGRCQPAAGIVSH